MRKKKSYLKSKRKPSRQKLDPIIKAAIINGIFTIIVALIAKLL